MIYDVLVARVLQGGEHECRGDGACDFTACRRLEGNAYVYHCFDMAQINGFILLLLPEQGSSLGINSCVEVVSTVDDCGMTWLSFSACRRQCEFGDDECCLAADFPQVGQSLGCGLSDGGDLKCHAICPGRPGPAAEGFACSVIPACRRQDREYYTWLQSCFTSTTVCSQSFDDAQGPVIEHFAPGLFQSDPDAFHLVDWVLCDHAAMGRQRLFSFCFERWLLACGPVQRQTMLATSDLSLSALIQYWIECWLMHVQHWLESFMRTVMLMSLLASFRLLAYAIRLKGGQCNSDPLLRMARAATKPVPIAFLFLVYAQAAFAMDAEKWDHIVHLDGQIMMQASMSRNADYCEFDGAPAAPSVYHLLQEELPTDPWEEEGESEHDLGADHPHLMWQAGCEAHGLQCESTLMTVWVYGGDTEADVTALVTGVLFRDEEDKLLIPVRPQPTSDIVHFLITATWVLGMGLYPVMLDNTAQGGVRFLQMLPSIVDYSDIRDAFGQDWVPGTVIWLAGMDDTLSPGETYEIRQGQLFVLLPAGEHPDNHRNLEYKLRDPTEWRRDIDAVGMPQVVVEPNTFGVWIQAFHTHHG